MRKQTLIKIIVLILLFCLLVAARIVMDHKLAEIMIAQQMSVNGGMIYYKAYERWIIAYKSAVFFMLATAGSIFALDLNKHIKNKREKNDEV